MIGIKKTFLFNIFQTTYSKKQPFGGNGEECMATAIDKNENILKFGYSFKNPGPRNKADRAIIRHNEACMYLKSF